MNEIVRRAIRRSNSDRFHVRKLSSPEDLSQLAGMKE